MKNSSKEHRRLEIKIVCAWCGRDMGEKDGAGVGGVSHSICEECLQREEAAVNRISAEAEAG